MTDSIPLQTVLQHGDLELKGQFTLGSNYTFLVEVCYEDKTIPAVYKPTRGEQPLWDFEESTLALREVAAYLVSERLGFHIVPKFKLIFEKVVNPCANFIDFRAGQPGNGRFNFLN